MTVILELGVIIKCRELIKEVKNTWEKKIYDCQREEQ